MLEISNLPLNFPQIGFSQPANFAFLDENFRCKKIVRQPKKAAAVIPCPPSAAVAVTLSLKYADELPLLQFVVGRPTITSCTKSESEAKDGGGFLCASALFDDHVGHPAVQDVGVLVVVEHRDGRYASGRAARSSAGSRARSHGGRRLLLLT